MYLTQMRLDLGKRATLIALSAPGKLHGAVEAAFSGPRQRPLWRIDSRGGQRYLLILSRDEPELSALLAQFAPAGETGQTKDYAPLLSRICAGSRWQFRLRANPTYSAPAGPGQRGRVCAHSTTQAQLQWLEKQSGRYGFFLVPDRYTVTENKWYRFRKNGTGGCVSFLSVTYDGILEVRDAELFRTALCDGIGPEKAYGNGLMTLMRAGGGHG